MSGRHSNPCDIRWRPTTSFSSVRRTDGNVRRVSWGIQTALMSSAPAAEAVGHSFQVAPADYHPTLIGEKQGEGAPRGSLTCRSFGILRLWNELRIIRMDGPSSDREEHTESLRRSRSESTALDRGRAPEDLTYEYFYAFTRIAAEYSSHPVIVVSHGGAGSFASQLRALLQ